MPSSSQAIVVASDQFSAAAGGLSRRPPALPWADPHSVSPAQLAAYIATIEAACEKNPASSDLRVCLGIAQAMNYEAYKSMDALERAIELDPASFIAQYKYTELLYRLRILIRAEQEGIKAAGLAANGFELGMAQRMLREIRRLMREGVQKPEWNKRLLMPALAVLALFAMLSLAYLRI